MRPAPVRVVVVDDSATARAALVRLLTREGRVTVVGQAACGADAIALVDDLRPDVVTMDIAMPDMDGYDATRAIMSRTPTPVLMVSALDPTAVDVSFAAIDAGAVGVLPKPAGGPQDGRAGAADLVETVCALSGVRMVTRRASRAAAPRRDSGRAHGPIDVIAIAASTGGPSALAALLRGLRAPPPVPVLVVQHIADGFDEGLCRWLDGLTPIRVRPARDGEDPPAGTVLVAPSGRHLELDARGRIALLDGPPVNGHLPSADPLFMSVAAACGPRSLGIILTGIGRDGVRGLGALAAAGGTVVAQDEATSVVYGMPRAAVEAGHAHAIVPIHEIPGVIMEFLAPGSDRADGAGG